MESWLAALPGRRFVDLGPICQDVRIVKLVIQVLLRPDLEGVLS